MMTCPATELHSATRVVLREICAKMKTPELTSLLRLDCVALRYEQDPRGLILTFVMRDYKSEGAMKPLLANLFPKLKALYAEGADANLFNINTATP